MLNYQHTFICTAALLLSSLGADTAAVEAVVDLQVFFLFFLNIIFIFFLSLRRFNVPVGPNIFTELLQILYNESPTDSNFL